MNSLLEISLSNEGKKAGQQGSCFLLGLPLFGKGFLESGFGYSTALHENLSKTLPFVRLFLNLKGKIEVVNADGPVLKQDFT
jgi:hypothetical protein